MHTSSSFEVLWVGLPLCLGILLFKSNLQSVVWKFTQILCVVFLVAAALLIGQRKGFSYHAVPAQYALVGVIALVLAEAVRRIRLPVSYAGLNIALMVILIAATVVCGVFLPRALSNSPLAAIVRSSAVARESLSPYLFGRPGRILFHLAGACLSGTNTARSASGFPTAVVLSGVNDL